MKIAVLVAAAAVCLGAASAAGACEVTSNKVIIANGGLFEDGGLPFDLQLKARWRVGNSQSAYLNVPTRGSIERDYPGNYPLVVDTQYSDKIRGWRRGGSVDVLSAVNAQLQRACRGQQSFHAITTLHINQATTVSLPIRVEVDLFNN